MKERNDGGIILHFFHHLFSLHDGGKKIFNMNFRNNRGETELQKNCHHLMHRLNELSKTRSYHEKKLMQLQEKIDAQRENIYKHRERERERNTHLKSEKVLSMVIELLMPK
jgi:hypothetical protein